MILVTAKEHFKEDIERARQLASHCESIQVGRLHDDLLRSAWMIAVGASDAYFCDAYADLVARTLRAKELQSNIDLPDRLDNLLIPVAAVIRRNGGWRWRMAARQLIEHESVLSLGQVKKLFNHFFDDGEKILTERTIESWILHSDSRYRMWGMSPQDYKRRVRDGEQGKARKEALSKYGTRMRVIFQRRHDCIHNCDRPKSAIQSISRQQTSKAIDDIEFLVYRCHEAFDCGFPKYLDNCGFSATTRNAVT